MEMRLIFFFFSSVSFSQPRVKLNAVKTFKCLKHVLRQMVRIQPLQMKLESIKRVSISTPVAPCSVCSGLFKRAFSKY